MLEMLELFGNILKTLCIVGTIGLAFMFNDRRVQGHISPFWSTYYFVIFVCIVISGLLLLPQSLSILFE